MKANKNKIELLLDSHNGTYIPQMFARIYGTPENFLNWDKVRDDIEILASENSQENEQYFDIWCDVIDNAILRNNWTLYENEDLWAVSPDYEFED